MRHEVEQELAYLLVIELLAHQFCFPVRWIETQDVLLEQHEVQRFIEIGPAATLIGMAKHTLRLKYESRDAATSTTRQFLSSKSNSDEIYYLNHAVEEAPSPDPTPAQISAPTAPVTAAAAPPPPPPQVSSAPAPAGSLEQVDLPINAMSILQAVIASKLKKADGVLLPSNATVKTLTGGRSTLQNEIIGDLDKEFGNLPNGAEETPLEDLAAALQGSFKGQLGSISQSMVSRMLSNKFPGDFGNSPAKKYLESNWGLGSLSQDAVLLLAVPLQPANRFGSDVDAKKFLDDAAQKYATRENVTLGQRGSGQASGGASSGATIDPKAMEIFQKSKNDWSKLNLKMYADELGLDLNDGHKQAVKLKQIADQYQKQLDLWDAEHGETYANGIQPTFTPLRIRTYDSYWNWAQQAFFQLMTKLPTAQLSAETLRQQLQSLANRSDERLICLMRYHQQILQKQGDNFSSMVLTEAIQLCENGLTAAPIATPPRLTAPRISIANDGNVSYAEVARDGHTFFPSDVVKVLAGISDRPMSVARNIKPKDHLVIVDTEFGRPARSLLHIQSKQGTSWEYDDNLTNLYLSSMRFGADHGLSFDKYVLLTGAGKGSIGSSILEQLLAGGAKVVVTTSSYSKSAIEFYEDIYKRCGSRDSQLVVAPFNQGSKQDVDGLVSYIYDEQNGLGWDLDCIIPFAAISENGREVDTLDSKSELAHRIMLTNTLRLLGAVKTQKAKRDIRTKPAQAILPLSPNHGQFGSDGLYGESKLSLETLFHKWHSESWADYLSICGAVIGWTRGTSLMSDNDLVASGIEKFGVRTFSREEMTFCILGTMTATMNNLCQQQPLMVNLSGNMGELPQLKETVASIREEINRKSGDTKAILRDTLADETTIRGKATPLHTKLHIQKQAEIPFEQPILPDYKTELSSLATQLQGMADLESTVVVVGFSELGPWGSSRTRWDMEKNGFLSDAGCIEMAWIMGLIKHHNGPLNGDDYCGWIDVATKKPIKNNEVKARYEEAILNDSGIRIWDKDAENASPETVYHEIFLQKDLAPFETSEEAAKSFAEIHGDKCDIVEVAGTGEYEVFFKKGAVLRIPKVGAAERKVAGLIPKGWDPAKYGITDDIIQQVDFVTLFALICTAEALLSAGITDPFELYKHVHVSQVGNCIGSGMGGVNAAYALHHERYIDKQVANDILQEAFINTPAAWVNMLLMSASGPIKTPVGACATSLESLESGYETILSGKAKLCLVGGVDDIHTDVANEFANMKATVNAESEFSKGRTPKEMSRPTTSTRNGFVEAHGGGVQIITTAKLALEMGLPIRGIVALAEMASDKIGRSIPAPGVGIMTSVRESKTPYMRPMLDLNYRRRNLDLRKKHIQQRQKEELAYLDEEVKAFPESTPKEDIAEFLEDRRYNIKLEAERDTAEAVRSYGTQFWKADSRISPLQGALAGWGLTIDDLGLASFHGTSTKKNDENETNVIHQQMQCLGRTPGNPLLGVFQKYLTGHSKGAAGAWMVNGCLQSMETGFVPGNLNADNIDVKLRNSHHITFPAKGIQTSGVKAFTVTSFGFGQKGAQAIGIHPKYLLATLEENDYDIYSKKAMARYRRAYRHFHHALLNNKLFMAKDNAPYKKEREMEILTNSDARVSQTAAGTYEY